VTNIEYDHPDCYPTPAEFEQAFLDFSHRLVEDGTLIVCADDPGAARLLSKTASDCKVRTYGIVDPTSRYHASGLRPNQSGGYEFQVQSPLIDAEKLACSLQAPGEHNVKNALAALAVANELGLPCAQAAQALAAYRGTGRRFEVRGEVDEVVVIDDYAHHPTETRATLSAARMRYPGRPLWVVWQPHTFSRTRALAHEFETAFGERDVDPAEHVIVSAIYAAREAPPADDFSAADLVKQMHLPDVRYIPELEKISVLLITTLQPGDVLLVLSAGDAERVSSQVLAGLEKRRLAVSSVQG
jgi:UDP-N-acetylmuramate--alanine ligase